MADRQRTHRNEGVRDRSSAPAEHALNMPCPGLIRNPSAPRFDRSLRRMATPPTSPQPPRSPDADAPEVLERFKAQLELVDIIARQTARAMGPVVELDD